VGFTMRKDEDPDLRRRAKAMRREMTPAERRLWWALRHRLPLSSTHFRRQVIIGRAIVDFACVATRTIVEVDGEQHGAERAQPYDVSRTEKLQAAGWRVLRFSNAQVARELDSVIDTILAAVERRI
jgi:very-short-patch-repair endonuclease